MAREVIEVGEFGSILQPGAGGLWMPGGFPTGDGGFWQYQEPDAVVLIQNGRLRVAAVPYTRHHDEVQILDNAKHMYFSTRTFGAPEGGRLCVEWEQSAQIVGARPGDLYDAFVSFHLLDLGRGVAANFFVGNDVLATVHARLPFPGVSVARSESGPRFFAWFEELEGRTAAGETHRYAIEHDACGGHPQLARGRRAGEARRERRRLRARAPRSRADDREGHRAGQGQRLLSRTGRRRHLGRHPRDPRDPVRSAACSG